MWDPRQVDNPISKSSRKEDSTKVIVSRVYRTILTPLIKSTKELLTERVLKLTLCKLDNIN